MGLLMGDNMPKIFIWKNKGTGVERKSKTDQVQIKLQ
jgi:hypothetical protein